MKKRDVISDASYKWKFAIGTTSRVPNSQSFHYLIADFDDPNKPDLSKFRSIGLLIPQNIFIQKTEHGWHMYTDNEYLFSELFLILHQLGADKKWIQIGRKRGYYFLADKSSVILPWPVERMVLHVEEKKTFDSSRVG